MACTIVHVCTARNCKVRRDVRFLWKLQTYKEIRYIYLLGEYIFLRAQCTVDYVFIYFYGDKGCSMGQGRLE